MIVAYLSGFRLTRLLYVLLLGCIANSANAQGYNPDKVSKKAINLYNQALLKANDGDFAGGIGILKKAIDADKKFVDAYLSVAGMYGELKQYTESVDYYEQSFAIDSQYTHDYLLPYSINLAGLGKFEQALSAVNQFLSNPKLNEQSVRAGLFRKKTYEFAIQYAREHPIGNYVFAPQNLGDSVNSTFSEYYPTLTLDGGTLVYTRKVNNTNEDFYITRNVNGRWTSSQPIPGNINSGFSEGAQNISQDGQWLIFTGCNYPEGFGSCDLYISYLTRNGWSTPQNFGDGINGDAWESAPSLSPDKKDLYFSSTAPGGYGGSDIWVTHRLPNGEWSEPKNLGPTVNTGGDESTPFIHADNQTLYFNSNGHPGYGGNDLFVARRQPDGSWSQAFNLGFPINTIEDEGSLIIASDAQTAFIASDRSDTRGNLDLYTFTLREGVRPVRTLWVKGKVFDSNTRQGLPSSVELVALDSSNYHMQVQTDENGEYLVTLPVDHDYAFEVKRKGYLFFSENFPLRSKAVDTTFQVDIPLQPIVANASVVLKNIFFLTGSYELQPESLTELNLLVNLLRENPGLKIQVGGHTDNVGSPADNLTLSNNRARSVVNYLVSQGIAAQRLTFKGYGESRPLADNQAEEGRARNRRTEITVLATQ